MSQVYWVISPVYYVARIFGLAPYSVEVEKSKTFWRADKFSVLYNMFATCVMLLGLIEIVYHINNLRDLAKEDDIAIYSDIFRRLSGAVISLMSTVLSFVKRHDICKFMEDMNDFDGDLNMFGITINYKSMRKENKICVVVTYSLLLLVVVNDYFVIVFQGEEKLRYWAACILFFYVNFSTVVQFGGFVLMLWRRFAIINKYMKILSYPPAIFNIWVTKQMTELRANRNRNMAGVNPISALCGMHNRLCECGKRLNAIYSMQILITSGISFVVLVIHLYNFYLMLSKNLQYELTIKKALNSAVWAILFFTMIYIMSFICSKTKEEADKTSFLIHQVNIDLNDVKNRTAIEVFTLQMYHQKMEFTAAGFFPVDFSLLYSIMGAVTTYLVFLIQFEMAARSRKH